MRINLTGHHVDLTPALHDYVKTKFERIERHFDHVFDVHVILEVERHEHRAETSLHLAGGKDVFADAVGDDMYAAIDKLVDKLDRQVVKHKEKLTDHHRGANPSRASI